jgi:hypothetical protein
MLTLRWILGSIIVLAGGGFVALAIVAGGFRRSFGASSTGSAKRCGAPATILP